MEVEAVEMEAEFRPSPLFPTHNYKVKIITWVRILFYKSQLLFSTSVVHDNGDSSNSSTHMWNRKPMDFNDAMFVLKQGNPGSINYNSTLYVPLLQECVGKRSLRSTRIVHSHVIKTGIYGDIYVCTFLVGVYAKCGSVDSAQMVFDQLRRRNTSAWTALITGYAQNNQYQKSIRMFIEMLESGRYPTNHTLGALLSICNSLHDLRLGNQIHGYAVKYMVASDVSVGNSLSCLYSNCRLLDAAVKTFNDIIGKNVISWTTIISACCQNGYAKLGLKLFREMLLEDELRPNEFTLISAVSMCCDSQNLNLGFQIHSMCIKYGCHSSTLVANSIMYLYLKSGLVDEGRKCIQNVENTTLVTWNAMISGYAKMMDLTIEDGVIYAHSRGIEALQIFQKLHRSDTKILKPDEFTYATILRVCSGLVAFDQGEQVHAQIVKNGCMPDIVVGSALVNMYSKCGSIENASKAFLEMPTRTLISWSCMIASYSQHGRSKEAILLFEDMRLAGVTPNPISFISVLSACSHSGMVDEAKYYFRMMTDMYGIKPLIDHCACMVDMFVRLKRLDEAIEFIHSMEGDHRVKPNEVIWSILIAGSRSLGKMDIAFYGADQLLKLGKLSASSESYALLLTMYVTAERWQDVSKLRKLIKKDKIPSSKTTKIWTKDLSWINIKENVHSFTADDRSHPQFKEIYRLMESLIDRAKDMGYVGGLKPLEWKEEVVVAEEDEEEEDIKFQTLHHSEKLAVSFGLLNTAEGVPIRIVKNVSMCRDCHELLKFFSVLTQREIIIRNNKGIHRIKDGMCCCGGFACQPLPI